MNRIIMIIIAAVAMSANCYAKKSARITYDERPENKQPVLERPAWPNYDLHDDRSFAAFSHVQTALEKPVRYIMTEGGSNFLPLTVYRCEDATYVCMDYQMPTSQDWLFFRFTTGSAIIDADTGDRYLIQCVEHFPLDQCFWVYGQAGETLRFVMVYPPLPPSVRRIQLYEASAESRRWLDGTGCITVPMDIDDLRPGKRDNEDTEWKTRGRIIR